MSRDEALKRLRAREHDLRARGAKSLYLFGSTARNEAGPASDVDVLLDVADDERFSLLDLIAFRDAIADLLSTGVDLIEGLERESFFRDRIKPDLVQVF